MNALLTEYDEEKVMKSLSGEFYEDGYEAGKEDGRKAGLTEGIRIFVVDNLEEGVGNIHHMGFARLVEMSQLGHINTFLELVTAKNRITVIFFLTA